MSTEGVIEGFSDKDLPPSSRNKAGRALVALTIIGIVVAFSIVVVNFVVGSFVPPLGVFLLGTAVGGMIINGPILSYIVVQVSQAQALTAMDMIKKVAVVYGPGWHFRYPWEEITERDNISLEERTVVKKDLTIAAKDDQLKVKISFQWRPDIRILVNFRNLAESTIQEGIFEATERLISSIFALLTADEARVNQSSISQIALIGFKRPHSEKEGKEIVSLAEKAISSLRGQSKERTIEMQDQIRDILTPFRELSHDLEGSYGIVVTQVNVSDVDFSESVQKARATRAEHEELLSLYYEIAGGKEAYHRLPEEDKRKVRAEARAIAGKAKENQFNFGNH